MKPCLLAALLSGSLFTAAGTVRAADFSLGFDAPEYVEGVPGGEVTFIAYATLTTENNTFPDGAQGWSLSIAIEGGIVEKVSLTGVVVSTIYYYDDPEDDPDTGVIVINPYDQDLGAKNMFTKVAAEAKSPDPPAPGCDVPDGLAGVISAVDMKGEEKQVLQPTGTQRILRIFISVQPVIPGGEVSLRYVNCLKSAKSQPVLNM